MPLTFSTTDSRRHEATVNGLENGHSYQYFARCRSLAGAVNGDDYPIAFSVAQTSQTVTLVPGDFSALKVYPNPWRADRPSDHGITFEGLTVGTTIKIFTVSGHKVKELVPQPSSLGTALWDLTNDSGDKVASGLYLYLITDGQGNKKKGQLAVIR
jgi:hypothetical protein